MDLQVYLYTPWDRIIILYVADAVLNKKYLKRYAVFFGSITI